jgi:hypothetical protein
VRKPTTEVAMAQLIGQIRQALPFDAHEAGACAGPCEGCSVKLLDYLESELEQWEARLRAGERPGLADLSKLACSAHKIQRVLQRNGLL